MFQNIPPTAKETSYLPRMNLLRCAFFQGRVRPLADDYRQWQTRGGGWQGRSRRRFGSKEGKGQLSCCRLEVSERRREREEVVGCCLVQGFAVVPLDMEPNPNFDMREAQSSYQHINFTSPANCPPPLKDPFCCLLPTSVLPPHTRQRTSNAPRWALGCSDVRDGHIWKADLRGTCVRNVYERELCHARVLSSAPRGVGGLPGVCVVHTRAKETVGVGLEDWRGGFLRRGRFSLGFGARFDLPGPLLLAQCMWVH